MKPQKSFIEIKTPNGRNVKIDKIKRYKWKTIGKPGEFLWIDKKELYVDPDYQRQNVNVNRINEFAADWCWIKCGVLTVVIRGDEWFVVDGQHRALAAGSRSDIKELPCMVFEVDGLPQEARAFVDINTSKTAVNGFDKFRALIVAEDEIAVGLRDLMATTGHHAARSAAVKGVACLMTIWKLFKKDKKKLTSFWPLISDINQDCPIQDKVVRGLYWAETSAKKSGVTLTDNPYRAFLTKIGGESLSAEIRKEINIIGMGGHRIEANAIIKVINKTMYIFFIVNLFNIYLNNFIKFLCNFGLATTMSLRPFCQLSPSLLVNLAPASIEIIYPGK